MSHSGAGGGCPLFVLGLTPRLLHVAAPRLDIAIPRIRTSPQIPLAIANCRAFFSFMVHRAVTAGDACTDRVAATGKFPDWANSAIAIGYMNSCTCIHAYIINDPGPETLPASRPRGDCLSRFAIPLPDDMAVKLQLVAVFNYTINPMILKKSCSFA